MREAGFHGGPDESPLQCTGTKIACSLIRYAKLLVTSRIAGLLLCSEYIKLMHYLRKLPSNVAIASFFAVC